MAVRTKRLTAHFPAPFSLQGVDGFQPAGDYAVDQDEELIEGISWLAYRRIATFIYLPAISSTNRSVSRMVDIDPSDLEAAVLRDRDQK